MDLVTAPKSLLNAQKISSLVFHTFEELALWCYILISCEQSLLIYFTS